MAQAKKQNTELKLFKATLDWNPRDPSEGDYCNWTWALDHDAAIRNIAEEMADNGEKEFDDDANREAYIQEIVDGAGTYAVELVVDGILPDVKRLLEGPTGKMSPTARSKYGAIRNILKSYRLAG